MKIDEKQIRQIIAEKYGIRTDDVCLYNDYKFVRCGDEKVRREFIYGIIDLSNKKCEKAT